MGATPVKLDFCLAPPASAMTALRFGFGFAFKARRRRSLAERRLLLLTYPQRFSYRVRHTRFMAANKANNPLVHRLCRVSQYTELVLSGVRLCNAGELGTWCEYIALAKRAGACRVGVRA